MEDRCSLNEVSSSSNASDTLRPDAPLRHPEDVAQPSHFAASAAPDAEADVVLTTAELPADVDPSAELTTADAGIEQPLLESLSAKPANVLLLDLPTSLALVGGQHPVVAFAQWRVEEAYARLDGANALWLPSLRAGVSYNRHNGPLQASPGEVIDVSRSSLQAGLGAGAVGAGTTLVPGVLAQFHVSDAIFQPRVAEKTAWARQHAATVAFQDQLLQVALAYVNLLSVEQEMRIIEETRQRTSGLALLTADYAAAGQGLQSDADRLATELILVEGRLIEARERSATAAARLLEAVSLDPGCEVELTDPGVTPIELVSVATDRNSLVRTALSSRPELKAAQCLVAAACDEFDRQRYAPFVPSVLLGFSQSGFGGGRGTTIGNFGDRMDFDALAVWEVRNLGFGEAAARRETSARVQQTQYEQLRTMDTVARQVSESYAQLSYRAERMRVSQDAIRSATDSYERNLRRIRAGQGLPLEVLQSIQAFEDAQRAYLEAVTAHNEAQFRLRWSLGWPVSGSL